MNTEKKIQEAAKKVFTRKGFEGARMQEIADEAGINKAMLHYYYRSKEKLFTLIALDAVSIIMPQIGDLIESEVPIIEKLTAIVAAYLDTISKNPSLPLFILHELSQRPTEFIVEMKNQVAQLPKFPRLFLEIQTAIDQGHIRSVQPFHLLLSTMSMIIFPFICRPIFVELIGLEEPQYDELLRGRHEHIKHMLRLALLPETDHANTQKS